MKSNKRTSLFLVGISLTTFLAFVGTTTGTLAWYAYSTRVSVAYMGTSVAESEQLQIGINDPEEFIDDSFVTTQGYTREGDIVWSPAGSGFTAAVISSYLAAKGNPTADIGSGTYANCLAPVTSKERALNSTDTLSLYEAPYAGSEENNVAANAKYYSVIPFTFRVIDNNGDFLGGKKIWITNAQGTTSGGQHIHESLRIFFDDPSDNEHTRRYLFNPSADESDSTAVAGILDLNGDGFYDRRYDSATDKFYEIIYGKGSYTGTPSYSADPIASDSSLDDINNTNASEATTFYAKHKENTHVLSSYSGLTFGQAYYYGFDDVKPVRNDSTGVLTGGKPVAETHSVTKIAYSTLTIYLEGWDHSVIDQAVGYQFNLGLTFEIDRV